MNGRNMVGMTEADVRAYVQRRGWVCVVAGVCLLTLAVIVAGWLVYVACLRWDLFGHFVPVLGWTATVYTAAVAVGKLIIGR